MSDRTQCVNINGVLSYTKELTFSVPQDSVFGPTLYCLYTRSIVVFGLSYNSFADDTQLHVKTTSIASVMCWETLAVSVNTSSFLTVKDFHSLVTSRLDHENVFLYELSANTTNVSQLVKNCAARLILISGLEIICTCATLPFELRVNYKVLMYTYKAVYL